MLQIAGLLPESTVDGPGLRYVVFTQGCRHYCQDCHNPGTWDEAGGETKNIYDILNDIQLYSDEITGVTISGGEPMLQLDKVWKLIYGILLRFPHLNITIYTGYKVEEVLTMGDVAQKIVSSVDYIIDGCYMKELKQELPFRGSANQRFIKVLTARI